LPERCYVNGTEAHSLGIKINGAGMLFFKIVLPRQSFPFSVEVCFLLFNISPEYFRTKMKKELYFSGSARNYAMNSK